MSIRILLLSAAILAAGLTAPASADEGDERVRLGRTGSSDAAAPVERARSSERAGRSAGSETVTRNSVERETLHGRSSQDRGRHRGHDTHVVVSSRHHAHHHEDCVFEPGHYETRYEDVVIPGYYRETRVPARYEVVWSRYRRCYVRVLIEPARTVRKWVPRRVEQRRKRVYVPGAWICVEHRTHRRAPRVDRHDHDDHDDHVRGRIHVRGRRGSVDIEVRR